MYEPHTKFGLGIVLYYHISSLDWELSCTTTYQVWIGNSLVLPHIKFGLGIVLYEPHIKFELGIVLYYHISSLNWE